MLSEESVSSKPRMRKASTNSAVEVMIATTATAMTKTDNQRFQVN